ncbi:MULTISPECIES: hypothetical protein [unclassified Halomonas]|uniref:hypothetical protein n=1 Tax=unclassified Halomonas TaxID=2609666 RepID=UPI0024694275|nr:MULTISPECIES: hypothetical protein [unclassified Halomonas]
MAGKVVVSDTNIWIDLYRGGLLYMVFQLDHRFVTTDFVLRELQRPDGQELVGLGLGIEALSGVEVLSLYELRSSLGNSSLADVSCYFLAKERNWTLLTGDGSLRRSGHQGQLDVRGVLWILDQLYDTKLVSGGALADSLETMLENGARLPAGECQRRIKAWRC